MHEKSKQSLGKLGEDAACRFYINRGYQVLFKNWYCNGGEIDLIVQNPTNFELIFVEVKTVSYGTKIDPNEQMSLKKRLHIKNSINTYIYKNSFKGVWKFDFIGIIVKNEKILISFYPNISIFDSW